MLSRSRRRILHAAIGSAAGLTLGRAAFGPAVAHAQASTGAVPAQRLSDSLHVLTMGATNVLAQTASSGMLLVDGAAADDAQTLLDALAALPASGPIQTLFNTHWHPEHTGLNERVGRDGARIVAHENTRLWLTTDITYPYDSNEQHFEPLPKIAQPNETFYDVGELESGIRYGYVPHAPHTDGDLYVQFPADDVLAVGDAVTGAGWPFVDWWTGGWIGGIVGGLELLMELTSPTTRVVPARGRILRLDDLESQYAMYNTLYERLSRMLNAGYGPDEAVAERPAAEFEADFGPSDAFVKQAFTSLWAYLSPDASLKRSTRWSFA